MADFCMCINPPTDRRCRACGYDPRMRQRVERRELPFDRLERIRRRLGVDREHVGDEPQRHRGLEVIR